MPYTVTLTTDKLKLHAFMQSDPIWAAYAIGDLEPFQFAWCTWYLAEDAAGRPAALALIYRRLDPPVLLLMGEAAAATAILEQAPLPERLYVSAREAHLPPLLARYDFSADRVRPMLRMATTTASFRPAPADAAAAGFPCPSLRRLEPVDVPAIEALLAEDDPFAPDAFTPAQVAEGVFYGVEAADERTKAGAPEDGAAPTLRAVAGTHLVAPGWCVAAVGNVYVQRDWRGRGLGALVCRAVTADLLQRGLRVVLNVDRDNAAAISLYRQLGFAVHCPFVEGIGRRRGR